MIKIDLELGKFGVAAKLTEDKSVPIYATDIRALAEIIYKEYNNEFLVVDIQCYGIALYNELKALGANVHKIRNNRISRL